jgi:hypothetical protein
MSEGGLPLSKASPSNFVALVVKSNLRIMTCDAFLDS